MKKDSFIIGGLGGTKKKLSGTIPVYGAKNVILKVMASSILFDGPITLTNSPQIEDVKRMGELLTDMGAYVSFPRTNEIVIDTRTIKSGKLPEEIAGKFRASIVTTGPLVARFGKTSFPFPGGCVIGERPFDVFLSAYEALGSKVSQRKDIFTITARRLKGTDIFFRVPSVTGTETVMMAAVLARGKTVLRNCAMEPEIQSLAEFLNKHGAKIKGAGTHTITIEGRDGELLHAKRPQPVYKAIPDRIETASFMILGALTGEKLTISNCNPEHVQSVTNALEQIGVDIQVHPNSITVSSKNIKRYKAIDIKTHEYPGFPTDAQSPMVILLTQCTGQSTIFETMYEGRLNYMYDLQCMDAHVRELDAHRAEINGPRDLRGRELDGPDLRTGFAFIIAGIIARGTSIINNVYYVDRGYADVELRLKNIGVDIVRVTVPGTEKT